MELLKTVNPSKGIPYYVIFVPGSDKPIAFDPGSIILTIDRVKEKIEEAKLLGEEAIAKSGDSEKSNTEKESASAQSGEPVASSGGPTGKSILVAQ